MIKNKLKLCDVVDIVREMMIRKLLKKFVLMRQSYRKLAHMNIKNKLKGVHTVCLTNSTISGESCSSV